MTKFDFIMSVFFSIFIISAVLFMMLLTYMYFTDMIVLKEFIYKMLKYTLFTILSFWCITTPKK